MLYPYILIGYRFDLLDGILIFFELLILTLLRVWNLIFEWDFDYPLLIYYYYYWGNNYYCYSISPFKRDLSFLLAYSFYLIKGLFDNLVVD